ncbi:hypothetical protein D3C79_937750 [compost metagenome]
MDHEQEIFAAGTFEGADDVVAHGRFGGVGLHLGTQCLEALDQRGADLFKAGLGAGTGVDRNQALEGFKVGCLFALGLLEQVLGRRLGSGCLGTGDQKSQGDGMGRAGQRHRFFLVVVSR